MERSLRECLGGSQRRYSGSEQERTRGDGQVVVDLGGACWRKDTAWPLGKWADRGGRHQLCTVNAAYGNQREGETGRSYRHTLFYCTSLRFTDVGFHKLKVRPSTNRKDYNLLNYDTRFIVVVWNLWGGISVLGVKISGPGNDIIQFIHRIDEWICLFYQ